MHQDESPDHGIEIVGFREVVDRGAPEFDIRRRNVCARKCQRPRIDIDSYYIAPGANHVGDDARNLADTAAHVEYSHILSDAGFLKNRARFFLVSPALSHETLVFGFRSATIDVLLRLRH